MLEFLKKLIRFAARLLGTLEYLDWYYYWQLAMDLFVCEATLRSFCNFRRKSSFRKKIHKVDFLKMPFLFRSVNGSNCKTMLMSVDCYGTIGVLQHLIQYFDDFNEILQISIAKNSWSMNESSKRSKFKEKTQLGRSQC